MVTIFLSPHLDDAVLSCGGLIWEMVQAGDRVEVWTICAGLPQSDELSGYAQEMHDRWGFTVEEAVQARKAEDRAALSILGVSGCYFDLSDAVYRRHTRTGEFLYTSDEDLFGGVMPGDVDILHRLAIDLADALPDEDVIMISPLTVGNHVDHVFVRAAAELLPVKLAYYQDFPYTRDHAEIMEHLAPEGYTAYNYPVSTEGLAVWQDSCAAYQSQISTFWSSEAAMRDEVARHRDRFQGVTLWEAGRSGFQKISGT